MSLVVKDLLKALEGVPLDTEVRIVFKEVNDWATEHVDAPVIGVTYDPSDNALFVMEEE